MGMTIQSIGGIEFAGDPPKPTRKKPQLTKLEWFQLRCGRGVQMTGWSYHACEVNGEPWVYYWPMGEQPPAVHIELIGDKNPIKAAEKFLAKYEKRNNMRGEQFPIVRRI